MELTIGMELPADADWRHAFDAADAGGGEVNGGLGRADAFREIMEAAGAAPDQITVAVVVHGESVFDVVNATRHAAEVEGSDHPNADLVKRIIESGGEIWVCARSATWHNVGDDDLLPGVRFAPSAMTAHAELQRRGFSLNPY
jgi:intracellular sulfur oxidation DsrE/DsrF family protein